ncbi:30916_t:CDS:10 [Gigaspora margarita]|uniref:30916_t:CDS:1 n=1 Tax=Gigaspora margarita TaxID=4874 RepID=A0ABN7UE45_GIGMA|nr:30916_t:CDS:10 [Gigaspora margarita]
MFSENLPYAAALEGEAEALLNVIVERLCSSAKAQDWGPGCSYWVKQLNGYLDLQHPLSRQTRAQIAHVLFELVITPGIDASHAEVFANTCIRLLKYDQLEKKDKIGPEDLSLPWEPLYDIIHRTFFPKSRQKTLVSESTIISKQIGSVVRLVEYAQRFFPPEAASEILSRVLHLFNANSVGDAFTVQAYLVRFLPTGPSSKSSPSTWLPTIFSFWYLIPGSLVYQIEFIDLVARVAEDNVGVEVNNPDQIGIFTQAQVKTVFATGQKMMDLPVGSTTNGNSNSGRGGSMSGLPSRIDLRTGSAMLLRKKGDKFKMLARFIVYSIFPPSNHPQEKSILTYLANMIQATESYYHPSNFGRWTFSIVRFLQFLGWEFLKRWTDEHKPECKTPESRRLTPDLKRQFVLTLRGVTFLSMFGKDPLSVGSSQAALKYLAWLEPSLIFPGLLGRVYPSLETLTETHRTTSSISALSLLAIPLFSRTHYPAGGKHLAPLLHLTIPGIDMNDPIKTISSLIFLTHAVMGVPLRDLTEGSTTESGFRWEGMDIDEREEDQMEINEEEEDALCKASTAVFEDWLAKFLRRVFTIFEYLPQSERGKMSMQSMETGLVTVLLHACEIVGTQMSEQLQDMALKMVINFASTTVLQNATKPMGYLCSTLTSPDRRKALAQFIPLCNTNIITELQHGAASTPTTSPTHHIQSDATLHWYQCILYHVIMLSGSELLHHKNDLLYLGKEMVQKCRSRKGYMWTGKFIRMMLVALTQIYPLECRNVDQERWKSEEYQKNQHKYWVQPGDPENINVDWHVPSNPELDFAMEILEIFLLPALKRIQDLMDSGTDEEGKALSNREMTHEFCRRLSIVRNCLGGMTTLVEDDGDIETSDYKDCETEAVLPIKSIPVGYCFSDPNDPRRHTARKLRKELGEFLHKLVTYFRTKREDDVDSLKILLKVKKSKYDASKRGYQYAKGMLKTSNHDKKYPRYLLVKRAYQQHLCRLKQNAFGRERTRLHDDLLKDLVELSLSSYSEIRKIAQSHLTNASRCFIGAKPLIIPILLDALEPSDKSNSERMKGALYLLSSRTYMYTCLRDWRFVPSFISSICQAQHDDKPSVQEMIRKVFYDYLLNYNNTAFKTIRTDGLNDAICRTLDTLSISLDTNVFDKIRRKTEQRMSLQKKNYFELVDKLLNLVKSNTLHWRFASMAANFLDLLIRPEAPASPDMAEFAAKGLVSELPALRRIAISTTTRILFHIKQRTLTGGDLELIALEKTTNPLKKTIAIPRPLPEGYTDEYLTTCLTKINENDTTNVLFQDKTNVGWYVWPDNISVYSPCTVSNTIPSCESSSQAAFNKFLESFNSSTFWSSLLSYLSQEFVRDREDNFSMINAHLFKSIFQMYEDTFLEVAKPEIAKLCESAEKNQQRAASEILAGLIRGSKHWRLDKLQALWDWAIPVLEKTFSSITPDSLVYWERFLGYCFRNRDPRRVLPLINLVLDSSLDPTSHASFVEAKKLFFVNTLINSFSWRIIPRSQSLLNDYFSNIRHPYKQVRDVMAANINILLQMQWHPSASNVSEIIEFNCKTVEGVGYVPVILPGNFSNIIAELVQSLETWQAERKPTAAGSSEYGNASKTVLAWLYDALTVWQASATYPLILPLLPSLFQMQDVNDDQDLQAAATHVLNVIASFSYPPDMVQLIIDKFIEILTETPSWHVRVKALPVLQVFFFKHLFMLSEDKMIKVMDVVFVMLKDTQIEVRQLAAVTLSGLIRCSQRGAIATLKDQFFKLLDTKIPPRNTTHRAPRTTLPQGFQEAILTRHAGVLGLSCLVNAFPYDVPKWMPEVLVKLAECISDPAPIQATVKNTFADFKRTHQDSWHEDMKQFTEDQMSLLSDMLISPSYYA